MGKTAVFVISTLEQIKFNQTAGVVALVLCHTRELAYQIRGEFVRFLKHMEGIRVEVFFGGQPIAQDREVLKNPPQVVIGTPGRILQLATEGVLSLKNIKHFILDECDKMLESLGKIIYTPLLVFPENADFFI